MKRRQAIALTGTIAAGGLAACLGDDDTDDGEADAEPTAGFDEPGAVVEAYHEFLADMEPGQTMEPTLEPIFDILHPISPRREQLEDETDEEIEEDDIWNLESADTEVVEENVDVEYLADHQAVSIVLDEDEIQEVADAHNAVVEVDIVRSGPAVEAGQVHEQVSWEWLVAEHDGEYLIVMRTF